MSTSEIVTVVYVVFVWGAGPYFSSDSPRGRPEFENCNVGTIFWKYF